MYNVKPKNKFKWKFQKLHLHTNKSCHQWKQSMRLHSKKVRFVKIYFLPTISSSRSFLLVKSNYKVFSKNTVGNATYDNFDYHCVVWDAWLNTFRKDSKVCQTQPINATHTKCICMKTGRFGLISTYNGSNVINGAINYPVNGPINGDKRHTQSSLRADPNPHGLASTWAAKGSTA